MRLRSVLRHIRRYGSRLNAHPAPGRKCRNSVRAAVLQRTRRSCFRLAVYTALPCVGQRGYSVIFILQVVCHGNTGSDAALRRILRGGFVLCAAARLAYVSGSVRYSQPRLSRHIRSGRNTPAILRSRERDAFRLVFQAVRRRAVHRCGRLLIARRFLRQHRNHRRNRSLLFSAGTF